MATILIELTQQSARGRQLTTSGAGRENDFLKIDLDPSNIEAVHPELYGEDGLLGAVIYLKRPLVKYADGSAWKELHVRETRREIGVKIQESKTENLTKKGA